jgi:NADPH:quinone reductase-like Zn-dependent oxidoreductase
MRILITGSNGDLAKYFTKFLRDKHYEVVAVSSSGKSVKELLDLNSNYSGQILDGITHVVHCAINPELILTKIEERFIEEISRREIKMIYIGSTSSQLTYKNRYGEYKNHVEKFVLSKNGTVITCGLIHGDQFFGQVHQIRRLLGFLPFGIEIIGTKKVYLTNVKKLSEELLTRIEKHLFHSERIYCFDSKKVEFNHLLKNLSGRKMFTFRIKSGTLLLFLNIISFKSNRFDSDRFRGLLSDFESDFEK